MSVLDQGKKYDFDRVFRLGLLVGGLLGAYWLLAYLADVLLPFGIAFVLAYLLNPVATWFQRKTGNRAVAVASTFLLFLLVVGVGLGVLIPRVVSEVSGMSRLATEMAHQGPVFWKKAHTRIPPEVVEIVKRFIASGQMQTLAASMAKSVAPGVFGVVTGAYRAVMVLMTGIIVLMYLVFLLLDFQRVQKTWTSYLPAPHRGAIVEFLGDFNLALSKYFRGQLIVAAIVGVLFAIGFSIIGLRLAVVLGLLIGLLNMVPYLQNVALVPAFMLATLKYIEMGNGFWWYFLGTASVFLVVQLVQDALLVPKIMGDVTGLRPAVIMLSIFVWGKLLGFIGLLLAIPLTVLAVTYYERYLARVKGQEAGAGSEATESSG